MKKSLGTAALLLLALTMLYGCNGTAAQHSIVFLKPNETDFAMLEKELQSTAISTGDFDYRNVYLASSGFWDYSMLFEFAVHAAETGLYGYSGTVESLRNEGSFGFKTVEVPILGKSNDFYYKLDAETVDNIFRDKYNLKPDHEYINARARRTYENFGQQGHYELLYDNGIYYEAVSVSYEDEFKETGSIIKHEEVGNGMYTVQMLGEDTTYYLVALKEINGRRVWSYYAKSENKLIDISVLPDRDIAYKDTSPTVQLPPEVRAIKEAQYGDHVQFGKYMWTVTDKHEGYAKLFCDSIVDRRPYNDTYTATAWADCSLRKWLNSEFIDTAFSDKERAFIADTKCSTRFEEDTIDKVYLPTAWDTGFGSLVGEKWAERWPVNQLELTCNESDDARVRIDEPVGIRPGICVNFS